MRSNNRIRLDMGARSDEFCHGHPDPNPATAQVPARLKALVERGFSLTELQQSSAATVAAAVSQKADLRVAIEDGLAALFGIARAAERDHPEVAVHRRRPGRSANEVTLLTSARVAVDEATTITELLGGYGLTSELLSTLTADLDTYEAALARQRNALTTQVGASAELDDVIDDIMGVVRNLDALHRVRFRNNPDLRAAWKSARNVAWPAAAPTTTKPADGNVA
jgi:hypothetical protein